MSLDVLPEATANIFEALEYLTTKVHPSSGPSFLKAFDKAFELIERTPHVGRPVENRAIREWSMPNRPYVIPYRLVDGDVEILRVWHTRKKKPAAG